MSSIWSSSSYNKAKKKDKRPDTSHETCCVKRCPRNVYKFYKNAQDTTPKWQAEIHNWMTDNFLEKELMKNNVFYKASNLICGPSMAGKTMFTSWFLLNLLRAHPDKRFLIFIYGGTREAVDKLFDMQNILFGKHHIVDFEHSKNSTRHLAVHTTELDKIKTAHKNIEQYYETISSLSLDTTLGNPDTLGQRVFSELQKDPETDIDLMKTIVKFTDYIFYFDDCIDKFKASKNTGKDPTQDLIIKLQTRNRHAFITTIYSFQTIKIREELFCSNLTNMFVIGQLPTADKAVLEKYGPLLHARFQQVSNLLMYISAMPNIFAQPKYTAQLFSQRYPSNTIYWGILPKKYIELLQEGENKRNTIKRCANTAVFLHLQKKQKTEEEDKTKAVVTVTAPKTTKIEPI